MFLVFQYLQTLLKIQLFAKLDFGNLRESSEIPGSLREGFGWLSEVFKNVRVIIPDLRTSFGDLQKCSENNYFIVMPESRPIYRYV